MTKDNDIVYIDSDTYYQIIGEEDVESYKNFLKNNPRFKDIDVERNKRKSVYSENIVLEQSSDVKKQESVEEKKTKLELQHEKDEDYIYSPHRIWLEQYLPRFEMVYGKFFYSNENLTNKKKCEELLSYYSEVCHIENIEDIKDKSIKLLRMVSAFMQKIKASEPVKRGKTH